MPSYANGPAVKVGDLVSGNVFNYHYPICGIVVDIQDNGVITVAFLVRQENPIFSVDCCGPDGKIRPLAGLEARCDYTSGELINKISNIKVVV